MLVKIIFVFLVAMGALAVFGRLRFPATKRQLPPKPRGLAKPPVCIRCGNFIIGKESCDCDTTARKGS